jgi:hypothetical protein
MSRPSLNAAPPCLQLFIYKNKTLREEKGILPLAFHFGVLLWLLLWDMRLSPFALDFLVWEAFGREKIAEGKEIAKGE